MPVFSAVRLHPGRSTDLGRYRIPIRKTRLQSLRRSKPFWEILGEHDVFSQIIRVPITFPAGESLTISAEHDLRASLDIPDDAFLALTIGRLTTQKGHTYLLEAVPAILERFPQVVFAFAGDGPLKKSLTRKVESLGIAPSVRFLGHCSDVWDLLEVTDIIDRSLAFVLEPG